MGALMTAHRIAKHSTWRKTAIGLVAFAVSLAAGTGIAVATDRTPPPPSWVDPDTGLVNPDKLPDEIKAVDQEGRVVGYVKIEKRALDLSDGQGPSDSAPKFRPTVPGAQMQQLADGTYVFRTP